MSPAASRASAIASSRVGRRWLFGIAGKGRLAAGYDADLTIVELKRRETIRDAWIASKSAWTPYDGKTVTGWPVGTVIRGRRVGGAGAGGRGGGEVWVKPLRDSLRVEADILP